MSLACKQELHDVARVGLEENWEGTLDYLPGHGADRVIENEN